MKKISGFFWYWLLLAAILTLIFGAIYTATQQNYRESANDPQIEMAENIANSLDSGAAIKDVMPGQPVDMAHSLSTFVIITDNRGAVLASSGSLDGQVIKPPQGALEAAASNENRVTWQPSIDVREATVIRAFSNHTQSGYVIVGRSLREVEKRIQDFFFTNLLAWAVTMIILLPLASMLAKRK